MALMDSCNEWKPFSAMVAIEFAFAIVNILLKKVLTIGMSHLVFITYRLSVSAIFLAPIGYFLERSSRPKLTFRILCYLFCSAIVGASLTQYFFLLGIQYTSATFACAFVNMVPVITFITALPFGMETVSLQSKSGRAKILGTLVTVGGAMMLTFYRGMPLFNNSHSGSITVNMDHAVVLSSTIMTKKWTMGSIALLVGTLLWSSWFLIQSKIGKRYPCQFTSTAFMAFFGAIQSAILSIFISRDRSMWVLKGKLEIITVLYSGMIGSGLSYVGMAWCVKKRGPLFTTAFSPLVQIMTAIIDVPFLHEQLHLGSVLGSLIVIIGLYILLWGKNSEIENSALNVRPEAEEMKGNKKQLQVITEPRE